MVLDILIKMFGSFQSIMVNILVVVATRPLKAKASDGTDFLVLDADSSQSEVINAAASGRSFVLQGPPGEVCDTSG